MSKKMLKRSLALGALMAFVITGSVWAAELNIADQSAYDIVKENSEWYHSGKNNSFIYSSTSASSNTVTIETVNLGNDIVYAGYVNKTGNSTVSNIDVNNNTLKITGTVENNDLYGGYINIAKNVNVTGSINCSGNNISIIGDASATTDQIRVAYVESKNDNVNVSSNKNSFIVKDNAVVNANSIYVGVAIGKLEAKANENNAVISGNSKVNTNVYGSNVDGDSKATAENNTITVKDNATVSGSIVAAYTNSNGGKNANGITKVTDNRVILEGKANVSSVFGAYAKGKSQNDSIEAKENCVTVSENVVANAIGENINSTISGEGIYGVYGAYVRSVSSDNNVTEASATAKAEGNIVKVTGGTVNGNVYGAYAEAQNSYGNAELDADANSNVVDLSGGTVKGDVFGGYSVKIAGENNRLKDPVFGTASNNSINISGTANVENANLYGNNGGEGTGNTLNISAWEGTIGFAQNFDVINIVEGASASFKTALNDANATVNVKGATWNVDKASTVGSANFDANSVLNIDGATFEAKDGNTAYALNGSGELKVADGATLKIEGIDYKKYNVAKGFSSIVDGNGENFADGDEYWKLENTLMQGVWTTDNGLQVEIKAKEAEDLATEMGVSVNIANTMTEIINVANNSDLDKEAPEVQKVVEFANALAAATSEEAGQAIEAVAKMAEASGTSATAAKVVANVTGVTNQRLSFGGGHRGGHKGGQGVGLLEEGSGAAIWAQYVHGKDSVEDMPSTAGASSYEGQHNGIVMGVDFKKVGKFQSGVAFNYGEGDTNSVATSARTKSEYDFWGIGYYGNIRNEDTNVIFDVNYAKTDSDVTTDVVGQTFEASPETTTWTAGAKVEKLYQNNNVQIVPYTGLRFMSIDTDDYSTKCGANQYKMERQDIWLLPLGVSIKQEVVNDNGWVVTPKVDLSYIWAFGDTDSNMEFTTLDIKTPVGYEVMDDGSWLGLVGVEATMNDWTFGVSYSYQKGDHSESKKWYVDAKYSF